MHNAIIIATYFLSSVCANDAHMPAYSIVILKRFANSVSK